MPLSVGCFLPVRLDIFFKFVITNVGFTVTVKINVVWYVIPYDLVDIY
jgi:hypothetical protein